MTASFTTRRILCTVIAATLVALPSNSALAGPAATTTAKPTATTTPPASTAPTSTPPASATPSAAPTSTPPADGTTPTDATAPVDGTTPTDGMTPPEDGGPPDAIVDPSSIEPPPAETPEAKPEEAKPIEPVVPEGPERPPEPTVANGKYKAKGTGLMIAGGTLFGVGIAGVISTFFLTRCPEQEDNFACKNRQHNTFAVPATASLALLGAVLLLVGAGYHVRYKRWERWTPEAVANKKTALTPTFLRGGAGMSYTVKF